MMSSLPVLGHEKKPSDLMAASPGPERTSSTADSLDGQIAGTKTVPILFVKMQKIPRKPASRGTPWLPHPNRERLRTPAKPLGWEKV
jgi:hypothetical protein